MVTRPLLRIVGSLGAVTVALASCPLPVAAAYANSAPVVSTAAACASVSVSASPPSPSALGTTVILTASATGCPNPVFEYWLRPPGRGWLPAQGYANAKYTWTDTSPAGTYVWSVWAKNQGSTASYEAFSTFDYTLTTCSGETVSVLPASSAPEGSSLRFDWTYQGCTNPVWTIWVLPPGGSWYAIRCQIPNIYQCGTPQQVDTLGWALGAYHFSVWLRSGPGLYGTYPNTYDTFSSFTYTITQPSPCSGVSVSASPASPATAGTSVTLTASVTGCPNPMVEFWMHAPTGLWTLAQRYLEGSPNPFTWSTDIGPAPPGTYHFSVWARDRGRSAPYDTFSEFDYVLNPTTPCSSASATFSPPATATRGTSVTITASATGCPNPEFEFWMLPPGGTWQVVGGGYFKGSGTFTWPTAGEPAGSYHFSVWARDAGSPGTLGAPPNTYDAFQSYAYNLT
jgi:hypothetical protein